MFMSEKVYLGLSPRSSDGEGEGRKGRRGVNAPRFSERGYCPLLFKICDATENRVLKNVQRIEVNDKVADPRRRLHTTSALGCFLFAL